jgi:hypothetical protein
VCTEYGRVEIADSDDQHVRLQIRIEGSGEGSDQAAGAAARVIGETRVHAAMTALDGRLIVRVWHSTLGFTTPGAQPAHVSVRLHVPGRGGYFIRTEAFHGTVAIRRLTVAGAVLRGNVGEKLKGIPGYIGQTELDNVALAGKVDIDNLVGLPGLRAPVASTMSALAAPIVVKARVVATSELTAVTGSSINIAVQPAPDLGVRATGESNDGRVSVALDGATAVDSTALTSRVRRASVTPAFDSRPVKITVHATSGPGNVGVSSMPAAPLRNRDGLEPARD